MHDKIEGPGFEMKPVSEKANLTGEVYAKAWLRGKVRAPHGEGYSYPAKKDVLSVLRQEPSLLNQFITNANDTKWFHDSFILERVGDGYDVYLTFEGEKFGEQHFGNLWDAVDTYFTFMGLK